MVSGYIEAGQVAAALMTKSGNIYTGICIDTACSLGMCAERNAIAHMLTCGESEIRKLAVVMSDGTMSLPCGACCEFMMQLGQWAGEIEILIDYQKAEVRQLKDLPSIKVANDNIHQEGIAVRNYTGIWRCIKLLH